MAVLQQRTGQPLPQCFLYAMRRLRRTGGSCDGIFRKSGVRSRVQTLRAAVESDPGWLRFRLQVININYAQLHIAIWLRLMGATTAMVARVRTLPTYGNPIWDPPNILLQSINKLLLGLYHLFKPSGTPVQATV